MALYKTVLLLLYYHTHILFTVHVRIVLLSEHTEDCKHIPRIKMKYWMVYQLVYYFKDLLFSVSQSCLPATIPNMPWFSFVALYCTCTYNVYFPLLSLYSCSMFSFIITGGRSVSIKLHWHPSNGIHSFVCSWQKCDTWSSETDAT